MFEAFRERDYRWFWTTQFLSNIGSWMQAVAQGWLVYRLTDSPFLLGFVGFANSAPAIVLMLPGGVLADQLDRRRVIALSQWAQAGSALWLAISIQLDRITVWQIVGATVVVGIAQSFSAPAYQAMILDLLEDRANLPNAVAMNSLQFNTSRALGPLVAGVALTSLGTASCFFANALSFLPLIVVLGRVRGRQAAQPHTTPMLERLREGLRHVRDDRIVLALLSAVAAASFFGYPYINLMPVLARTLFTNDATGTGYLMGAVGAGALAGALALSVTTVKRAMPIIIGSFFVFGVALAIAAVAQQRQIVMAMLALDGVTMVVSIALCNTMIQQRVPDVLRGRVLSLYTFSFFAFAPFGNLVAGAIAERAGITKTLVMLGAAMVVSGVAVALALRTTREGQVA